MRCHGIESCLPHQHPQILQNKMLWKPFLTLADWNRITLFLFLTKHLSFLNPSKKPYFEEMKGFCPKIQAIRTYCNNHLYEVLINTVLNIGFYSGNLFGILSQTGKILSFNGVCKSTGEYQTINIRCWFPFCGAGQTYFSYWREGKML